MKYYNIKKGEFVDRPNRFIANVKVDGKLEVCHVKNTGRCKELLTPGATVYVQECNSSTRKTKFDLISVYKGDTLINMDSQAPNKVFGEWISKGNLFENITLIKPETTFGKSRFDYYIEADGKKIFAEVKGVTLEEDGIARFPDAPTERGIKHLEELAHAIDAGYHAYAVFIIQMKGINHFEPNWNTHREFGEALLKVQNAGVNVIALDCLVTPESLEIDGFVEVMI